MSYVVIVDIIVDNIVAIVILAIAITDAGNPVDAGLVPLLLTLMSTAAPLQYFETPPVDSEDACNDL